MNSRDTSTAECDSRISNPGSVTTQRGEMGGKWEQGQEEGDIHIPMADVWQKPTQCYCKAIILKLKINF